MGQRGRFFLTQLVEGEGVYEMKDPSSLFPCHRALRGILGTWHWHGHDRVHVRAGKIPKAGLA